MSDFLAKLIAEGKDILGESAKVPDREDSVKMDRFDLRDWQELKDTVPTIQRIEIDMERKHDYVPQFLQDLFALLFKAVPEVTDPNEMKPTHRGLNAMIVEIGDMPEFQHLRQHATGDNYASAMGMISMKKVIEESLDQAQKLTTQAAEDLEQAQTDEEDLRRQIEELMAQLEWEPATDPNGPPSKGQLTLQELLDALKNAQAKTIGCGGILTDRAGTAVSGMRQALRQAAGEAAKDLEDEGDLMRSFGVDDGELKKMSFDERAALAQQLRGSRLAKFLKLLGQFKTVQQAESRKRVVDASNEVHGVTFSDHLHRLTAGEFLNFASEELELLFWKRFVDKDLLTFDVRGTERQGQGPIIVVCDESGSMETADVAGGTREAWSKALALAMLEQAKHRNRDFIYIGFSSSGQQHVVRFVKGQYGLAEVLRMTEHFYDGGTHYEKPLRMALDIVREYDDQNLPKPDVVFLTDDEYGSLSPDFMREWLETKDKTSMMCYGIAIGCGYSGALAQVSDNVRSIVEIASDPRMVGDLFRSI